MFVDSAVEPLLTTADDSDDRNDLSAMVNLGGGSHTRPRRGILSNRRDQRKSSTERWGRIRLGILSICFLFVIYICFSIGLWVNPLPQIVVNVPPMDESLPGPKGTRIHTFLFCVQYIWMFLPICFPFVGAILIEWCHPFAWFRTLYALTRTNNLFLFDWPCPWTHHTHLNLL